MKRSALIIALLLFSAVVGGCSLKKTSGTPSTSQPKPTPIPTRPIEETIGERPYVSLILTSDRHWVNLEINNIPAGVNSLEYDLIYLADAEGSKIERGVSTGGIPVELKGARNYAKKVLFGSASCTTGVCKYRYDENVSEGTLVLTLIGSGKARYEAVYRIQKGAEAAEGLTTGDGIFAFTSVNLPAKSVYLVTSTIGVPKPLPPGLIPKSEPYAIYPQIIAKGKVAIKTNLTEAAIYGYNGKSWQKLTTTIAEGEAVADSSGNYLFILTQ